MTTPQEPQDPQQPPPPASPYGAPPNYGTQPPAYGAPPPSAPYGAPFTPGAQPPPSKAMAVVALILSVIACAPIAIILAIVVLVRGRDGRPHGKGLAIAAIVISVLWVVLGIILVAVVGLIASNYTSADDLTTGQCVTAKGLSGDGDTVDSIKTVSCSTSHDGEVVASMKLSADDADGYDDSSSKDLCFNAINGDTALTDALVSGNLTVIGLTQSATPDAGDNLACIAFDDSGKKLTSKIGS